MEIEAVRKLVEDRKVLQAQVGEIEKRIRTKSDELKKLKDSLPVLEKNHATTIEAHHRTRSSLGAELDHLEANPPRLFGKANHERKVENAKEAIASHDRKVTELTEHYVQERTRVAESIDQQAAHLASEQTSLESLANQLNATDSHMANLQGAIYSEVFRRALAEMVEKASDRAAYFDFSTKLEGLLASLPEIGATKETADRCRILYAWVTAHSFQKWYRGNYETLCTTSWSLSRKFLDAETTDWMFEAAVAFGAMKNYEYWMRLTDGMEEEFQFNVRRQQVHREDLEKVERKLIHILKNSDESTKKLADSFLDSLNEIRQLD